jgi:hypothetical protein
MAVPSSVQKLKGTWEYVDGEHFDDWMKEIVRRFSWFVSLKFYLFFEKGVGFALRQSAKLVKPKLIISEKDGKWLFKSESTLKSASYEFKPGVEFDETRLDGELVKVSS